MKRQIFGWKSSRQRGKASEIRDNGKHYMCQVLPPLLKPDYPKQTFLEKAPPPTLHIKLAVSHILKAMKPKFPQIKPYLASLGIVENPEWHRLKSDFVPVLEPT